jgi:hypothetical protein
MGPRDPFFPNLSRLSGALSPHGQTPRSASVHMAETLRWRSWHGTFAHCCRLLCCLDVKNLYIKIISYMIQLVKILDIKIFFPQKPRRPQYAI